MTPTAAPRQWRCLVALLSLLAVMAALVAAVAMPVTARHAAYRDAIDQSRRDLVRYQRIIDAAPALRAEIERLRDTEDASAYYLSRPTSALAAAELQDKAKEVVRANGGTLTSTQVLQTRGAGAGDDERVVIRVQMTGDTPALQRVMYRLEAGQPLLFIDKLTVQAAGRTTARATRRPNRAGRRTTPQASTPPKPRVPLRPALTVSFDLSGYRAIDTLSPDQPDRAPGGR